MSIPPFIFTSSFHDFPFQYRISIEFVFYFPYVIGQISFMSLYFMYEATFMIEISLKGPCIKPTYTFFYIIIIVALIARVEYFSLEHYTLYLTSSFEGAVFFLNTVTIWGFSIFISI